MKKNVLKNLITKKAIDLRDEITLETTKLLKELKETNDLRKYDELRGKVMGLSQAWDMIKKWEKDFTTLLENITTEDEIETFNVLDKLVEEYAKDECDAII